MGGGGRKRGEKGWGTSPPEGGGGGSGLRWEKEIKMPFVLFSLISSSRKQLIAVLGIFITNVLCEVIEILNVSMSIIIPRISVAYNTRDTWVVMWIG